MLRVGLGGSGEQCVRTQDPKLCADSAEKLLCQHLAKMCHIYTELQHMAGRPSVHMATTLALLAPDIPHYGM